MKKRNLTLVEILIASFISTIFMGMVIAVIVQIYDVSKDNLVDAQLNDYSRIVKEKLLRTYGLRNADVDSVEINGDQLTYQTYNFDTEFPDFDNLPVVKRVMNVRNGELLLTGDDLAGDLKAFDYEDIEFVSATLDLDQRDPADFKSVNKLTIRLLFRVTRGSKSYMREEFIHAPLFESE